MHISVHPLVVPAKASDVAQVQIAQTKSPVAVVVGQANQPVGDLVVFNTLPGLIAVAGLADHKDLAGQLDWHATHHHRLLGCRSSHRRPCCA